jgi:hypothetical protein
MSKSASEQLKDLEQEKSQLIQKFKNKERTIADIDADIHKLRFDLKREKLSKFSAAFKLMEIQQTESTLNAYGWVKDVDNATVVTYKNEKLKGLVLELQKKDDTYSIYSGSVIIVPSTSLNDLESGLRTASETKLRKQ